jgi:RNA polymerase sigma factor (sigma-70 family)
MWSVESGKTSHFALSDGCIRVRIKQSGVVHLTILLSRAYLVLLRALSDLLSDLLSALQVAPGLTQGGKMDEGSDRARLFLDLDPIRLREFIGYFDAYQQPLITYAGKLLRDKVRNWDCIACDCVQETFMELARAMRWGLAPFATGDSAPAHVKNWLFKVAKHRAKAEIRRAGRHPHMELDDTQIIDAELEGILLDKVVCDELLARLAPLDAEILRLRYEEGLYSKEIAARLRMNGIIGITADTVRGRKKRALAQLRNWLEGADP